MSGRILFSLAGAALIALAVIPAAAADKLNGEQIRAALSGNTVQGTMEGSGAYAEFYSNDGMIRALKGGARLAAGGAVHPQQGGQHLAHHPVDLVAACRHADESLARAAPVLSRRAWACRSRRSPRRSPRACRGWTPPT